MTAIKTISIIVPVFNVLNEINRCVESILSQSFRDIEVILVDDGSTDGSGSACDEFALEDARIKVIHKENGGLSSARNAGMACATGAWLMFVDSDDALMPNAFEKFMTAAAIGAPDIIVGDAIRETQTSVEPMLHSSCKPMVPTSNVDFIETAIINNEFFAPSWMNMYRRRLFVANNLLFAEGLLHEDMEMQPRVFLAAKSVICIGQVFYRYIDRAGSIMNGSKMAARRDAMRLIYGQWKSSFDSIGDSELKRCLYGHLAKCYLHTVRELDCGSLNIQGIDGLFLLRSGLNLKEKVKALMYVVNPKLLVLIGGRR